MKDPKQAKLEFEKLEKLIFENKIQLTRPQLFLEYLIYCDKNSIVPLDLNSEDLKAYKKRKISKVILPFFIVFIMLFAFLLFYFDGNIFGSSMFFLSGVFLIALAFRGSDKYELLLKQLQHGAFESKSDSQRVEGSLTAELAQLDKLYKSGTLTESEFMAAKSKLISK